jgi:hypothetical protein
LNALLAVQLALVFVGCAENDEDRSDVVAVVYEETFYETDLLNKLPQGYQKEDSARLADQIVSAWIRDKALLKTAEANLTEAQKDVQKQLDDYRNSLLVYAYERAFMNQKLDTVIGEDELQQYYETYSDNFFLKRNIVKVQFIKLSVDAPQQRDVERWLTSSKEEDADLLYEYCRKYAENFYFNSNVWLFVDDLSKEVPLPLDNLENFLKSTKFTILKQEDYNYFVNIHDFRLKGDQAPLSLEKDRIRDLILNRRKAELIAEMRDDLVKEGFAEGYIKIYTK